jgi:hypothetical protein
MTGLPLDRVAADFTQRHPAPSLLHELLALRESDVDAAERLAQLISRDEVLFTRLRHIAGAGWWGEYIGQGPGPGIAALGYRRVHSAATIILILDALDVETFALDILSIWTEAITTAFIATALAYGRHVGSYDIIFAAALLRDIGRLAVDEADPSAILRIRDEARIRGQRFEEVEQPILGYSILDLTLAILARWRIRGDLTAAISQAESSRAGRSGLSVTLGDAVRVAHQIANDPHSPLGDEAAQAVQEYFNGIDVMRHRVDTLLGAALAALQA